MAMNSRVARIAVVHGWTGILATVVSLTFTYSRAMFVCSVDTFNPVKIRRDTSSQGGTSRDAFSSRSSLVGLGAI